jgi:chorismate mutase
MNMMTREEGIEELARCRDLIDALDLKILDLINERTRIVERIGAVKRACELPIYEPKREDQVYANILGHNSGPLPPDGVKRVFERIIDEMRQVQRLRMIEAERQEQQPKIGDGSGAPTKGSEKDIR